MNFRDFRPMCAKGCNWDNKNIKKTLKGLLFTQPKLDGIRCNIFIENGEVILQSRQGKVFKGHAMDDLKAEVQEMYNNNIINDKVLLDGELYVHGLGFNDVQSLVTNVKGAYDANKQCKFNVYDMYDDENPEMPFKDRRHKIKTYLGKTRSKEDSMISVVKYDILDNSNLNDSDIRDVLYKMHDKYVEEGYEGLIIRTADGVYGVDKRPNDLLKLKAFKDEEYTIVAINEGIGKNVGIPTLTLALKESDIVNPKNTTFNAVLNGKEEYRKMIWENRDNYIGQPCTVKFFEKSDDNVPRFPVVVGIRDYE